MSRIRGTDGFGAARDSGEFSAIRDSGGFSDGFEGAHDSTGSNTWRDSGESGVLRDSGGFTAGRDSGGFRAARDSGGFGALPPGYPGRDPRQPGPQPRDRRAAERPERPERPDATREPGGAWPERRNLRYTPTVAASGPIVPASPPPEFTDPRPSGPIRGSSLLRPAGPAGPADPGRQAGARPRPGSRRQTGPQGQPAAARGTGPQTLLAPPLVGPQARPPHGSGPQAMPPYAAGPRAVARPDTGPQPPARPRRAGARYADGLDGQRGQQGEGTVRQLRQGDDERPEPGAAKRLLAAFVTAIRSRNLVTGLAVPILAAIAVGIAVVVIAGANSGLAGPATSSLSAGYPPARSAAADFTDTAALAGRGISEPLGQVAAFGSEVVAVGSQSGARIARARFFYSTDAGRTWQLGTVQEQGAAVPPPGDAAALVAGGAHGWLAVGSTAVWISRSGQQWLLEPALPQLPGDKITTLVSTGSGFLAAGQNIPAGNAADASPVVWLSANGTTWQRLSGTQLGLTADTGRVLGITAAAANGGVIVLSGTVAGATTSSQVWRSANGGRSWTPVTIPAGGGAAATISGLAPLKEGFVAVRRAMIGGFTRAAVYVSGDGTIWRQSAVLATADNAPLTVGLVSGGTGGAVVTGEAHGLLFAFLSQDGVTWTGTDPVGTTAGEQLSGVALTSAGQAVMVGTSAGNPAQQQPLLTLIGAQGGPDQINVRAIPGAIGTELAVNAIAASAATQVAVGSADGFPALWESVDGGSTWQRATGANAGVLTRPDDEQLTGVTHGAAGWLAVGGGIGGTAEHPVVVGSAGGQTWTAEDGAAAFTGAGQLVTAAAAAGTAGYVIVGHETANGHTVAAAWYASGLTGWQRAADAEPGALDGTGNRQLNAVTATEKGFAGVGAVGAAPAAWLSATGRTWSLVTLPLPGAAVSAELQYVAASGDTVAATGTELTAAGQQLPFAAVSDDGGATWAETVLPAPRAAALTAVTELAAAGGGFTATGTFGTPGNEDVVVWTLAQGVKPGTTWTAATPAGTGLAGTGEQAITALTGTGSTLTGIGFSATPASEEPTIWQSPVRS